MLESMIENPSATRAEISDVANAVYDFTDATMLSGETAFGKYPERVVSIMARTAEFTEKKLSYNMREHFSYHIADEEEMICDAAYELSRTLTSHKDSVGGFIVFTSTGRTPRKLSRYRPNVPIYAFTPNITTYRALTLSYGVLPILRPEIFTANKEVSKNDIMKANSSLESLGSYDPRKHYVLLHGDVWAIEGKTSTIKVIYPR